MAGMIAPKIVMVHLASMAMMFCLTGCASRPSSQRPTPATAPADRGAPFDAYRAMADALESEDAAAYRAAAYADGQAGRKSIDDLAKSISAWAGFEQAAEHEFGPAETKELIARLGLPRPREIGEKLNLDLANELLEAYEKQAGPEEAAKATAPFRQQDSAAGVRRWAESLPADTAAGLKSELTQLNGDHATVAELTYEYGQPAYADGRWKIDVSRSGEWSRIRAAGAQDPAAAARIRVLEQTTARIRSGQYHSAAEVTDAMMRALVGADQDGGGSHAPSRQ
jgi:hypothetical protein